MLLALTKALTTFALHVPQEDPTEEVKVGKHVHYLPLATMTIKPAGTSMEGMIWNANHVLDMALAPGTKKPKEILKGAQAVLILNTVDVGIALAGTRGSGVLMAKRKQGEWSAPSAVTFTGLKIGWILGAKDKGLIAVFTDDKEVDNFISGPSIDVGAGCTMNAGTVVHGEDLGAVNSYVTSKGIGSCFIYTYAHPPSFEGCALEAFTIRHNGKANEHFYGKVISPQDIICKGNVIVPEGSGIPDLHKKLAALEAGEDAELCPGRKEVKETLHKTAPVETKSIKADMPDEIEAVTADMSDGVEIVAAETLGIE